MPLRQFFLLLFWNTYGRPNVSYYKADYEDFLMLLVKVVVTEVLHWLLSHIASEREQDFRASHLEHISWYHLVQPILLGAFPAQYDNFLVESHNSQMLC